MKDVIEINSDHAANEVMVHVECMPGLCSAVIISDIGVWSEGHHSESLDEADVVVDGDWESLYQDIKHQVVRYVQRRALGNLILFSDAIVDDFDAEYGNGHGDIASHPKLVFSEMYESWGAKVIYSYTSSTTFNDIEVYALEI